MLGVQREVASCGPGRRAVVARRQRSVALAAVAAFAGVLLAVTTGATKALDRSAAEWFRPQDSWGEVQVRLGPVIDGLEPRRAYVLLGLVTLMVSLRRHDWRPAVFAGVVATVSMGATSAVKM